MTKSKYPAPGVQYRHASDCPDAALHTPHPSGYIAHANWADRMKKTHRQVRCQTCGFWAVWVSKADGTICMEPV